MGGTFRVSGRYIEAMRWFAVVSLAAALTLLAIPAASAKDFRPGDLRVCNASRCVPIKNRAVLRRVGLFYYTGQAPVRVQPAAVGSRYYELRLRNGYVTGIVATRKLDRFLSNGVNIGRFERDTWYRVPKMISLELRRLTQSLRPLRLTQRSLGR